MKLLSIFSFVCLSTGQIAFAQVPKIHDLCGVPVAASGCTEKSCKVSLRTAFGAVPLDVDSSSLLKQTDLEAMAKAGGVQCFSGYRFGKAYRIVEFAD